MSLFSVCCCCLMADVWSCVLCVVGVVVCSVGVLVW